MSPLPQPSEQAREATPPASQPSAGPAQGDDELLLRFARQMRTPLIIEPQAPNLTPGSVVRNALTLAIWGLWFHFLMPLITLFAWMTGWKRLSTQLLTPEGLDLLQHRLPVYLAVLGMMCGSLVAWALFNWWRFADRDRRKASPVLDQERQARELGVSVSDLRQWHQSRRMVVHHDQQGGPRQVDGIGEPQMLGSGSPAA